MRAIDGTSLFEEGRDDRKRFATFKENLMILGRCQLFLKTSEFRDKPVGARSITGNDQLFKRHRKYRSVVLK